MTHADEARQAYQAALAVDHGASRLGTTRRRDIEAWLETLDSGGP